MDQLTMIHLESFRRNRGICKQSPLSILIGGDFNLIREESDKNYENINHHLMDLFNNFIGDHHLRELKRSGQKFTWTNKQEKPIMVNLDRVFFSLRWEEKFPLSLSWGLIKVGSGHSPIVVDNGESLPTRPRYFYFDQQWLLRDDLEKWSWILGERLRLGVLTHVILWTIGIGAQFFSGPS
jgi:hypothetical protein